MITGRPPRWHYGCLCKIIVEGRLPSGASTQPAPDAISPDGSLVPGTGRCVLLSKVAISRDGRRLVPGVPWFGVTGQQPAAGEHGPAVAHREQVRHGGAAGRRSRPHRCRQFRGAGAPAAVVTGDQEQVLGCSPVQQPLEQQGMQQRPCRGGDGERDRFLPGNPAGMPVGPPAVRACGRAPRR